MPASRHQPALRPLHLITAFEAAERLDVSVRTVRRFIADGRLPGYRVGRLVKLDSAEVDAFIRPIPAVADGQGR